MEGDLVRVMCEAVVKSTTLKEDESVPDFDLINALHIHDLVLDPVRDLLGTASDLLFGARWSSVVHSSPMS